MKYKILLASLLPISIFTMEIEPKKNVIKIAQVAPTQEQRDWLSELYRAIENHTVACTGENFTNSNKETYLNQIKELIIKLKAQDALNYTHEQSDYFPLNHAC